VERRWEGENRLEHDRKRREGVRMLGKRGVGGGRGRQTGGGKESGRRVRGGVTR